MDGALAKRPGRGETRPRTSAGETPEPSLDAIVRELEDGILFGKLRPRERLVEDQLMARFGAKRYTVRQALAELEKLGIVVRSPNRGAAVRDFTAREVEEIYEIRYLLQARAVERMALPADAALIDRLSALQRRHDAAVGKSDLRTIDAVNDAFHRTFFTACGNQHLCDAIMHYAHLTRAMRLYVIADPVMLAGYQRDHWAMIRALAGGARAQLVDQVTRHLEPSKRLYLSVRAALPDHAEAPPARRRVQGRR